MLTNKKIGYFFNGYLGDKLTEKSQDSPDGNAWYSSSIIYELLKRNNEVYIFQDKDKAEYDMFENNIFSAFEKDKRVFSYINSKKLIWQNNKFNSFENFDLILLEWRFPIPGRNTKDDIEKPNFSPDLLMQDYILDNYNCPIIIFDLDYKITKEDEEKLKDKNVIIFETASKVKEYILKRYSVEIPFWVKKSNILENKEISKYKDLVYIGSRYERDEIIKEYIVPYSDKEIYKVWFYGNWRKYPDKFDELFLKLNWRNIQYHNRVGHSDFKGIYQDSLCCPLLAKDEYFENGFMTARILECLYFGSIPIGFRKHYNIEKYLPEFLIADNFEDFYNKIKFLKAFTIEQRNNLRKNLWKHLEFMDVSNFVNKMEEFYDK